MRKYYTGVGSRQTPFYILYMMSEIAIILEKKGYVLRSGCATGADAAFEDVLEDPKNNAEIYIPNKGFPFKMGTIFKNHYIIPEERFGTGIDGLYCKATRLIHNYDIHKGWKYCKPHIMKLHNRNMFQVLGIDLKSKSDFNVCYTRGKELLYTDTTRDTGGTGTSINASDIYKVPLFNLSYTPHYRRLQGFIKENKHLINYDKLNNTVVRSELLPQDSNNRFKKRYIDIMPEIALEIENREKLIAKIKKKEAVENKPVKQKQTTEKKGIYY